MTLKSYTHFLSETFLRHFPAYTVKINRDCDDARCLFVSIYGVPRDAVDGVESAAYDIIQNEITPQCAGFMPTPEIVDEAVTRRCYPAQMPLKRPRRKIMPMLEAVAKKNSRLVAAF